MRFGRTLVSFIGLTVMLVSGERWLIGGLSAQKPQIVFSSTRDGKSEIYVMDSDGKNHRRLTANQEYNFRPAWSPDGTKIAFVSNRNGGFIQIYVMEADGKNPIRLTNTVKDDYPSWSPDGKKIAFASNLDGEMIVHIAVMDADGDNLVMLEDHHGTEPSWSPDGQEIAFVSRRDGVEEIYVMGADGRNRTKLTHNREHHWLPAWSPDGRMIAYASAAGDGRLIGTIHLMTADGQYLKQLSDVHNGGDYGPDFGPIGLAVSPTSNKITIWGRLKKLVPNLR